MGTVGEFTVSNIHMDQDALESKKNKTEIDMVKLQGDIDVQKDLARQGKLHEAIEGLLNLEKQCRQAEDAMATKQCCVTVLEVCYDAKQWKLLEENILLLSKRRSQLKQAIQGAVRQAIAYIDDAPDADTKVSLIKTLQAVTEGKIYVEIERARLTRRLAAMREAEGNIAEAADILQEIAVETFGAMAKTEKIEFILEQVRLCLDKQDFIRAQILARKISPRAFVERKGEGKGEIGIEGTAIEAPDEGTATLPELQRRFYDLMIRYHSSDNNYLEMCRCYKAIYDTPAVQADEEEWKKVLTRVCWLVALAPAYSTAAGSSSDHATLLQTTMADKKLAMLPECKALLTKFATSEIISWPAFQAAHAEEIKALPDIFDGPAGAKRMSDLQLRVMEHSVMVVAKYYTRVTTSRLAELLGLPSDEAEKHMADLVVSNAISAKIDRPSGVIRFGKRQEPEDLLNKWSTNISNLLELVDKACQQIQKEAMIHKVNLSAGL